MDEPTEKEKSSEASQPAEGQDSTNPDPAAAEPAAATAGATESGSSTGLESNVAGLLSYLLGVITGIVFYVIEDKDQFVRFHAMQSIIVFGGLLVLMIALSVISAVFMAIPIIGWIIALLLWIVSVLIGPVALVAWILLMYKAYQGEEYEFPVAGKYARQYM